MDIQFETEIVKTFFNKQYQERILYELTSKKKRLDAFGRLCHEYKNVLNPNYMQPYDGADYKDILKVLREYGASESCYVISYNKVVDGKHMNLEEALKIIVGYGMASFVLCIPNKLAYFEAEQVQGAPPRYILRKSGVR